MKAVYICFIYGIHIFIVYWLVKRFLEKSRNFIVNILTLSCLPIYPMPSLKVFYQNMDYYNELNIYKKVLNEFRPNFAETW